MQKCGTKGISTLEARIISSSAHVTM